MLFLFICLLESINAQMNMNNQPIYRPPPPLNGLPSTPQFLQNSGYYNNFRGNPAYNNYAANYRPFSNQLARGNALNGAGNTRWINPFKKLPDTILMQGSRMNINSLLSDPNVKSPFRADIIVPGGFTKLPPGYNDGHQPPGFVPIGADGKPLTIDNQSSSNSNNNLNQPSVRMIPPPGFRFLTNDEIKNPSSNVHSSNQTRNSSESSSGNKNSDSSSSNVKSNSRNSTNENSETDNSSETHETVHSETQNSSNLNDNDDEIAEVPIQTSIKVLSKIFDRIPIPETGDWMNDGLKLHNRYRALIGIDPLQYSDKLQKSAQKWAEDLATRNVIEKSGGIYGENMYQVTSNGRPKSNLTSAVKIWFREFENYNGEPINETPSLFSQYGHFSQVVWPTTKEVGCGHKTYESNETSKSIIVCHCNFLVTVR